MFYFVDVFYVASFMQAFNFSVCLWIVFVRLLLQLLKFVCQQAGCSSWAPRRCHKLSDLRAIGGFLVDRLKGFTQPMVFASGIFTAICGKLYEQ